MPYLKGFIVRGIDESSSTLARVVEHREWERAIKRSILWSLPQWFRSPLESLPEQLAPVAPWCLDGKPPITGTPKFPAKTVDVDTSRTSVRRASVCQAPSVSLPCSSFSRRHEVISRAACECAIQWQRNNCLRIRGDLHDVFVSKGIRGNTRYRSHIRGETCLESWKKSILLNFHTLAEIRPNLFFLEGFSSSPIILHLIDPVCCIIFCCFSIVMICL